MASSDTGSIASIEKDRKEKVKAMMRWMTSHLHDITPEVAKKYSKKFYGAGVPTIEKLAKKIGKDPSYLQTSKFGVDPDDARELIVVLSSVFGVSALIEDISKSATSLSSSRISEGAIAHSSVLSPDLVAADRKEKAEEMIAWYRANTNDITVPNMHRYSYILYDDNCATITKVARKLERDVKYLHNLSFDPDDVREIVGSLKVLGILKADFQPYDEKQKKNPVSASNESAGEAGDNLTATMGIEQNLIFDSDVQLVEVDSSRGQQSFAWGLEVVGLLLSIFSEETHTWLEGKVVRFDTDTRCHYVRFPDNFELDVDLNTHLIRIELKPVTLQLTGGKASVHRIPMSKFLFRA